MRSLGWVLAILAVPFLAVAVSPARRRLEELFRLHPRVWALLFLWLGTKTITLRTNEEVLAPLNAEETYLRGALALVALVLLAPHAADALRAVRHNRAVGMTAMMVYTLVAGVSVLWTPAPLATLGKTLELGVAWLIVASALADRHPERALRQLLHVVLGLYVAMLAGALAGRVAFPGSFTAVDNRPGFIPWVIGSPYAHSNGLAAAAAILGVFALAKWLQGPDPRWLALGGLSAAGLALSSGRQGVVMAAVGVCVVLLADRRRAVLTLVAPVAGSVLWLSRHDLIGTLTRGQTDAMLTSLSGRTDWWEAAMAAFVQQPWLGYGFGAGSRFAAFASHENTTTSVHNGLLEALLGVGLIGTALIVFALALAGWWALRAMPGPWMPYAVLLVLVVVRTGFSIGIGGWVNEELILFLALAAFADLHARAASTDRPPMESVRPQTPGHARLRGVEDPA